MKQIPPTFNGFLHFIRHSVGVPDTAISDDNETLICVYEAALEWVPQGMGLECLPVIYRNCVYNLAASFLLHYADDTPPGTYFADTREKLGIGRTVTGIMTSAADQGTSGATVISDAISNLSLADLMLLQDPYGAAALAILMEMGSHWGMTP